MSLLESGWRKMGCYDISFPPLAGKTRYELWSPDTNTFRGIK